MSRLFFIVIFIFANAIITVAQGNQSDSDFRQHYVRALEGDKDSQFVIGKLLLTGSGTVRRNVSAARVFLDRSIKQENGAAAKYTAEQYETGEILPKNLPKALSFYSKAKDLGIAGLSGKILTLSEEVYGSVSPDTCSQYSTTDQSRASDLARCVEKGFILGDAGKFWIWDFDNGNDLALISAAKTKLDVSSAYFDPDQIVIRIPEFALERSDDSERAELSKIIVGLGFSSSNCATGKDSLGLEKVPDVGACVLAAAAGDFAAVPIASAWWRSGQHDLPPNPTYADFLLGSIPKNEDVDIAQLCLALEGDPKKHFRTLIDYLEKNPFNRERIASCLTLEMGLIASGDIPAFAESADDVAWVLSNTDWNNLDKKIVAETLYKLRGEYSDIKVLSSESVEDNLSQLIFDPAWMGQLISIDRSREKVISQKVLAEQMLYSCGAIEFALENPTVIDKEKFLSLGNLVACISFDPTRFDRLIVNDLQLARSLINRFVMESCEAIEFAQSRQNVLDVDVVSMSPVFDECIAQIAQGGPVPFEQDARVASMQLLSKFKGSREEQCGPFVIYLNNKNLFKQSLERSQWPDLIKDETQTIKFCARVNGQVAGWLAESSYLEGKTDAAFEHATSGCELQHFKSCGLQAHITYFFRNKIREFRDKERRYVKNKALAVALRGYEIGESEFSGLIYYDIAVDRALNGKTRMGDKILNELLLKGNYGAELRDLEKCIKFGSLLNKCRDECVQIDRLMIAQDLDYLSKAKGRELLQHRKCN